MGVTAADFDGDGDEDLFMTHLQSQSNTLYTNDGRAGFLDSTQSANLSNVSMRMTGFGTAWFDYDNDGLLDLFLANGAVAKATANGLDPQFPYGQINQLLRNRSGRFEETNAFAGTGTGVQETSRGAAFGDLDNDGFNDAGDDINYDSLLGGPYEFVPPGEPSAASFRVSTYDGATTPNAELDRYVFAR